MAVLNKMSEPVLVRVCRSCNLSTLLKDTEDGAGTLETVQQFLKD
jgi:hypothetical protein